MGSFTAQILVGSGHPNHDGIIPEWCLFLSENSRPAWFLMSHDIFGENDQNFSKIRWIPTVENMLEDGLLMIGIHIVKDKQLIKKAKKFCSQVLSKDIECYTDFTAQQRQELYERCRSIRAFPKIILSIFQGSTIRNQLSLLEKYPMDVEVCTVSYSRLSSSWDNSPRIYGSL